MKNVSTEDLTGILEAYRLASAEDKSSYRNMALEACTANPIGRVFSKYSKYSRDIEDLRQDLNLIFFETFDKAAVAATSAAHFRSYMYKALENEIRDRLGKESLPMYTSHDRCLRSDIKTISESLRISGISPHGKAILDFVTNSDDTELKDKFRGISAGKLDTLVDGLGHNVSGDDRVGEDGEETFFDFMAADDDTYGAETLVLDEEAEIENGMLRDSLESLPPRNRAIVEDIAIHRLSQAEVARKLGISQQRVSKIYNDSIRRLRDFLEGQIGA